MKRTVILFTIITLTIGLAISTITLVSPLVSVNAFSSKGSPDQSCSPNGVSGTDVNPNCVGGRLPNCTAHNKDDASGCRDQGTCQNNQPNDKRKTGPTPACPFE